MNATEVSDELKLIVRILDKLSEHSNGIRRDQVQPLLVRLTSASENVLKIHPNEVIATKESDISRSVAVVPGTDAFCTSSSGKTNRSVLSTSVKPRPKVLSKSSRVKPLPIPRSPIPSDPVRISKEVVQSFTTSLYNLVEGTACLLRAASCSVYVRQGDEMISIVNVRKKLSFPPQLERHRVVGSNDAEVLGSGIALNQRVTDRSKGGTSVLIFPIFSVPHLHAKKGPPIATIHVENKLQGLSWFDALDESIIFLASCLIGELMFRVPQMDWISNFYDPITQHIVSPFIPAAVLSLPSVKSHSLDEKEPRKKTVRISAGLGTLTTENTRDKSSPLNSNVVNAVENYIPQQLIKRESLPIAAKSPSCGLLQLPTPREVKSFLENIEECWKDSVTASVNLTETDRGLQMEVRRLRLALENLQRLYSTATEKLRLYELNTSDYQQEFKEMKAEFEVYTRNQENLHI